MGRFYDLYANPDVYFLEALAFLYFNYQSAALFLNDQPLHYRFPQVLR